MNGTIWTISLKIHGHLFFQICFLYSRTACTANTSRLFLTKWLSAVPSLGHAAVTVRVLCNLIKSKKSFLFLSLIWWELRQISFLPTVAYLGFSVKRDVRLTTSYGQASIYVADNPEASFPSHFSHWAFDLHRPPWACVLFGGGLREMPN